MAKANFIIYNGISAVVVNKSRVRLHVKFTASDNRVWDEPNYEVESIDPVVILENCQKTLKDFELNPPVAKPTPAQIALPYNQAIDLLP